MDNLRTIIIHSVILYYVGGVYESNERLLVYFLDFLLGALSFQQKITAIPQDKTLYIIASSIAWIPVTLHIGARLYPIFFPEVLRLLRFTGSSIGPVFTLHCWVCCI